MYKHLLILSICSLCSLGLVMAQVETRIYTELGGNNLSAGASLKTGVIANYTLQEYTVGGGWQSSIVDLNPNLLSGIKLHASRSFSVKEKPYSAGLFYVWKPYSTLLHQTLWGVQMQSERTHWITQLGMFFRTYAYTHEAQVNYNFTDNDKVHENWNLMYSIDYSLNTKDAKWNAGIRLSNVDYFGINQATNPVLNLHGMIRLSEQLELFGELYYLTAGAFNLHVNSFGYLARTGIVWNID